MKTREEDFYRAVDFRQKGKSHDEEENWSEKGGFQNT